MGIETPLVFSCSGCSFAGQLANSLALELDRQGIAEMSCLAGVGAQRPSFMKQIRKREVWIIDGCPIECSRGIFDRNETEVDAHIRLHDLGIKKKTPPGGGVDLNQFVELIRAEVSKND